MDQITETSITLNLAGSMAFDIELQDSDGVLIDASTADLKFIVDGLFRVVPTAHPDEPMLRLLVLTEDHARQVQRGADFVLLQTYTNGQSEVVWDGVINSTGFEVTP